MTTRYRIARLIIICITILCAIDIIYSQDEVIIHDPSIPVEVHCTEDMPCWDCEVMGNLICGGEVR